MTDPKPGQGQGGKVTAKDGHVYHKSKSANADVAPTNAATVENATKGKGLTPEQLDFVTIVNYEWGLQGSLPTKDFLKDEYKYTTNQVLEMYSSEAVATALAERGVELRSKHLEGVGLDIPPVGVVKPTPKLTAIQLIVANKLLDISDTKSERKKLQDTGVTTMQYQQWLRDPDFQAYMKQRAEQLVGDLSHEAMLSLADGVRSGNIQHIKYYHELTGRFVEAKGSNAGSSLDLNVILIRIFEILNDEIDDPEVASRISDRLRGLVQGGAMAAALTDHIVVPETAPPRELTTEVKALMAKGAGYDS